jgi:hypothetical protein
VVLYPNIHESLGVRQPLFDVCRHLPLSIPYCFHPLHGMSSWEGWREGCLNGPFWIKMTVRMSISSVRPFSLSERFCPPVFTPRTQFYPPDTVLPIDRFLPRSHAIKICPCEHEPRLRGCGARWHGCKKIK